ncbi:MAG TPA: hypothetical protein VFC04_09430 [Actinomycetota bacterium]|nr:hypothetical protein [Actinomycetota bacterium]
MRAELYRADEPEHVVAVAIWSEGEARLEVRDAGASGLERLLRQTPVLADDPALRRQGTHGPTLLHPGDLEWFRAALLSRAGELGLAVRFVPEAAQGGWDPAGEYRPFRQQVERLVGSNGGRTAEG